MKWNWQLPDWPKFSYDAEALRTVESKFLQNAGHLFGAFTHLNDSEQKALKIHRISEEALKTSEIEGEYLNRESLQSSIRKQFGLKVEGQPRITAAERGVAEMMVDVYRNFAAPLSKKTLVNWHAQLLGARKDLKDIGRYRTHAEPMQVISGAIHAPTVHFEAPPSKQVPAEMKTFLQWYQSSAATTAPLARAGIAHLHFLAIHPFSDGNGRIARALSEKALAEAVNRPTLIALAQTIEAKKQAYYTALQKSNHSNVIDHWLDYFANTVLTAQRRSLRAVQFLIEKTKFHERLNGKLNDRQSKVIKRLFEAGSDGFAGGLSAENYIAITKTSRATATRDLQDLVLKHALTRTGELKHTRYQLNL